MPVDELGITHSMVMLSCAGSALNEVIASGASPSGFICRAFAASMYPAPCIPTTPLLYSYMSLTEVRICWRMVSADISLLPYCETNNAATPVTCGVAIDVPSLKP